MVGYYRRFIPQFATIAKPLTFLLKKNVKFIWNEMCQRSFQTLKDKLVAEPILAYPNYSRPFILSTDASEVGVGAVLSQENAEHKNSVVAYASHTLSDAEQKYSTSERECLGILFGIEHFRPYLEGMKFTVVTDHSALCWLKTIKDPHGRLGRWSLRLQNLNYEVKHVPGKENLVADALSRAPVPSVDQKMDNGNLLVVTSTPSSSSEASSLTVDKYQELKRLQDDDEDIRNLLKLMKEEPCVVSNKLKRFFLKYKNKLVLIKNVLYIDLTPLASKAGKKRYRLVLPNSEIARVLKNLHDSPLGGHMGITKTLNRIKSRYLWVEMPKTVKQYVRSCPVCQLMKSSSRRPIGVMQSIQAKRPMEYIAMDFIGPLPKSGRGNRYLVIFIDLFTKWIEAFPIREATAGQAADKLMDVVYRHGTPHTVITDRGTQFTSNEFGETLCSLNIHHNKCSIRHPEANQAERAIRTLKSLIRCYLEGKHSTWDNHINELLFAIRSAPQESTGESPSFLMYGRDLDFPIDKQFVFPDGMDEGPTIYDHTSFTERIALLHSLANKKLAAAHERHARYYSQRRREHTFKEGDLVKVVDFTPSSGPRKMAAKLSPRWKGPFRISRITSANNCELKFIHNNQVYGNRHTQQIEPYFDRPAIPEYGNIIEPPSDAELSNILPETQGMVTDDSSTSDSVGESTFERMFGPTDSDESSLSLNIIKKVYII